MVEPRLRPTVIVPIKDPLSRRPTRARLTGSADSHCDPTIKDVDSIRVERGVDGNESGLRIDSGAGQSHLLRA